MTMPADEAVVSFAEDIKPLFRPSDRASMTFAFDLWDIEDVRANAEAIFDRLRDGTMPCDRGWPSDKIELFHRWITTGLRD